MRRRLVILTEIISPYRIPLFNALAQEANVDLHVIFLAETDPTLREWQVFREEIRFSFQVLPSWRRRVGKYNFLLNKGVSAALGAAPGRNSVRRIQLRRLLASSGLGNNSKDPVFSLVREPEQDRRRGHAVVELLKTEFLHKCSGFVVPGHSARESSRS